MYGDSALYIPMCVVVQPACVVGVPWWETALLGDWGLMERKNGSLCIPKNVLGAGACGGMVLPVLATAS